MSAETRIKVRGYHLDFYGHVNNARYLEFLEEARWRLVEDSASLREWRERGLAFVIVKIEINYRLPALLDDELCIRSELARIGGRSGVIQQVVLRGEERVADADVTFVVVDTATQKAVALEGEVREALEGR
jgi:thioesterase-3